MSNYQLRNASTTAGNIIAGLSIGFLLTGPVPAGPPAPEPVMNPSSYSSMAHSSTVGQYSAGAFGQPQDSGALFEQAMSGFFEVLAANQSPLEQEFETILYDNLWDLYAS